MPNEHGLRDVAGRYLQSLTPEVLYEKRWGGAFFGRKGVSDFTGIAWGVAFAIELKHPYEKSILTLPQAQYQARVRQAGGQTLVTNNLQEIKTFMARLREIGRTCVRSIS